ncbi:hypothetical protein [Paucibacter soli]|uniref:hypothetical protein n=1 Tax=Paucibacter soli TaxID=3133433 RepID=UPI0030A12DD1
MKHLQFFFTLLAAGFSFASNAAPVVVQKGSISGYVFIPGTSVQAAGGSSSSSSSGNCYFSPTTDQTFSFSSLPAELFPLAVDYKMVGGGGGGSENNAWGAGGGGGSSAILVDGAPIAVANGGNGADQGQGAGTSGTVVSGRMQINSANTVRFIVGGGGGTVIANTGYYYYENYSNNQRQYYYGGSGGGAGYFGGGGGGSGQSSAATNRGKGGIGGGSSGGAGGAAGAWISGSSCLTDPNWSCTKNPGLAGTSGVGGAGGNNGSGGSPGGSQVAGGVANGSNNYNSYSSTYSGFLPSGPGGGLGSGGGVSVYYPSSTTSTNYTIRAGSNGLPSQTNFSSFGSNTFTNGGISGLSLAGLAGAGGDPAKQLGSSGGQIVLRYSAPLCNAF